MPKNKKTLYELTVAAGNLLKYKLLRADGTVKYYHCLWRKLARYMTGRGIQYFDSSVGKAYLLQEFGDVDYAKLGKKDKDLIKAVNVLCEFYDTGTILSKRERTVFEGPIGELMKTYFSHLASLRLKEHSIGEYEHYLHRFLCFLHENKIDSVKEISQLHLLHYIKGITPRFSSVVHLSLRCLRGFFKYLYEQQLLDKDMSLQVPKDNYKKQARLPSTYSQEEIATIINSIDRSNSNGKRNYAIVLLASRLGLRACDIENLKFENLDWESSRIIMNQYKTGKRLELPILSEVGEAIIDYLKYGRPISDEPFIFLLSRSPYTPLHGSVTGIVHASIVRAGINISGRKHGAHVLRHSLAGRLLEAGTILPVISEVLGHENTESTRYYLRIDLKSMNQCMLEVPPVSSSFYSQKGGYFYV